MRRPSPFISFRPGKDAGEIHNILAVIPWRAGEVKAIAVYVLANSDSAIPDEPFTTPPEN